MDLAVQAVPVAPNPLIPSSPVAVGNLLLEMIFCENNAPSVQILDLYGVQEIKQGESSRLLNSMLIQTTLVGKGIKNVGEEILQFAKLKSPGPHELNSMVPIMIAIPRWSGNRKELVYVNSIGTRENGTYNSIIPV